MLFSLCQWGEDNVIEWGAQLGQMFRFNMDHIPFFWFPPKAAGKGFGQGTGDIIEYMGVLKPSTIAKQYGWMDPDFAETLFPITMNYIDSRTEFTFWTLWSAPLLIATDLRNLTTEKYSIIANPWVLAIQNDTLATAGDRVYNRTDGGQLWSRPLASGGAAIVFYNRNNFQSALVNMTFDQVGLPVAPGKYYELFDLWKMESMGNFSSTEVIAYKIAPHDVLYMRAEHAN
jgi:alpha-galactosidase